MSKHVCDNLETHIHVGDTIYFTEDVDCLIMKLTTLQAENERWEGLRSYLSHTFDCNRGKPGPEGGCTCGLTKKVAVLKEGE